MTQLYLHIHKYVNIYVLFQILSHVGYCKISSIVPCAIQRVLIYLYIFDTYIYIYIMLFIYLIYNSVYVLLPNS